MDSPRITSRVRRTRLAADTGEARGHRRPLADLVEDHGFRVRRDVVRDLEVAECARALGVHNTLRNAFAIEMRDLVDVVGVLEEDGTARASRQRAQTLADWTAVTRRELFFSMLKMRREISITLVAYEMN